MAAPAIMAAMVQAKAFIMTDFSNEWTVGYAQKRVKRMILFYTTRVAGVGKKNDWGHWSALRKEKRKRRNQQADASYSLILIPIKR